MSKMRIAKSIVASLILGLVVAIVPSQVAHAITTTTFLDSTAGGITCTHSASPSSAGLVGGIYGGMAGEEFTTLDVTTLTSIQVALFGVTNSSDLILNIYGVQNAGAGDFFSDSPLYTMGISAVSGTLGSGGNTYTIDTFTGNVPLEGNSTYFIAVGTSTPGQNSGAQVCADTTTYNHSTGWSLPQLSAGNYIWGDYLSWEQDAGFTETVHMDFSLTGYLRLATPNDPVVSNIQSSQISVADTTTVSNVINFEYDVYLYTGSVFFESQTVSTSNIATPTVISGLSPSTKYYITVKAIGDGVTYANSLVSYGSNYVLYFTTAASVVNASPIAAPALPPAQESRITGTTPDTATAGAALPVSVHGSFVETVRNIDVNGISLKQGTWTQTPSTVSFSFTPISSGIYYIQLYNGSMPLLALESITVTTPPVTSVPAVLPVAKPHVTYIHCYKGNSLRIAYGINPVCPVGFTKK